MADKSTRIFRVELPTRPPISRDIEIEPGKSLYWLAEAIVRAFDFDFDHAFGFYSGKTYPKMMKEQPKYELFADMGEQFADKGEKTDAKSVKRTAIAEAFPRVGHAMLFLFDYGDEWLFRVKLIGSGERTAKTRYPRVIAGTGKSPVQYPDPDEEDEW